MVAKPDSVSSDAFKSAKWDELTAGRDFAASDVPTLTLLCQWYAVVERCMSDIDYGDGLPQVAYQNDMGDLKPMPQLSTMKQASAEIRALNKQLGIDDSAGGGNDSRPGATILSIVSGNRAQRQARTA